jgi:3-dehydroquinate synthase
VIYGIIVELFLSVKKCGFSMEELQQITAWLFKIYGKFEISETDYEALFELMTHDKKNEAGRINFTLIPEIGKVEINQNCIKEEVFEALDYYRQYKTSS